MELLHAPGKVNLVDHEVGWIISIPSKNNDNGRKIYPGFHLLCHRGQIWIDKAYLLSKMSVCHWNEVDRDDVSYDFEHIGTN